MTTPEVQVFEGKLKGKVCQSLNNLQYYTFKGIPYAKPPIGELRFSAPEPPESWEGVRDSTKDCNICIQFDRATQTIIGDEDCLYLNVYTPKLPTSEPILLPVMVFIHGGGFVFGHGTDDSAHGPDFLIEKDVVIVSMNYRLGILGFLCLNHKDAPGNMGLRDQVRALKWIQQNIRQFGGDSNNVTIFGFSAGAACVEYLLLSPLANGLFHKAIAHSGSSLLPWAQNEKITELASRIPLQKGKVITDDEQLLKYFKSLPAKDLITSSMLVLAENKFKGGISFGFVPTIEKQGDWVPFLDQSTYKLLTRGEFTKVPFISGFCSHEGLLMLPLGSQILEKIVKEKSFIPYLPFKFDDSEKIVLDAQFKDIYLEKENNEDSDAFALDFFSDIDFIAGIYVATKLIAKNNSPVYFYEFSYDGGQNYMKKKWNINREGACHGDDGGYLIKIGILSEYISDKDKIVRDRLVEMWTNFAKFGDPTPKTDNLITTKWEPIAETGMAYLHIDDNLTMQENPYPERMKFLKKLYEKYYG